MKCFVTGATGFLGSHVARQLLARGAELRLLVRPTSRTDNIADLPAERVVGDLRDPESLKKGMAGCEFVFHVAADYRLWALNGQELYDSNVEGTRNILQAARDTGVRRVIYTSSVATMGFGNNGRLTDESTPVTSGQHDWRLQAQQVHGRAAGDRGGAGRTECGDGESDDARSASATSSRRRRAGSWWTFCGASFPPMWIPA